MRCIITCLSFSLSLFFATPTYPHGGGLDTYGCHHDRKAGGYHCHRGQFAGQSFGSKDEMLRKMQAKGPEQPLLKKAPAKPLSKG